MPYNVSITTYMLLYYILSFFSISGKDRHGRIYRSERWKTFDTVRWVLCICLYVFIILLQIVLELFTTTHLTEYQMH